MERKNLVKVGCMITYSGIIFNLMKPRKDLILLEDIAHGLAFNCRWNGHSKKYYSIAEHSIRGAKKCDTLEEKLNFLFHDAEEAYWSDIISPIKAVLREHYPEILNKTEELRDMIFSKFGIESIAYKERDYDEAIWEWNNLVMHDENPQTMSPEEAEKTWLAMANELLAAKA